MKHNTAWAEFKNSELASPCSCKCFYFYSMFRELDSHLRDGMWQEHAWVSSSNLLIQLICYLVLRLLLILHLLKFALLVSIS